MNVLKGYFITLVWNNLENIVKNCKIDMLKEIY